MSVVYVGEQRRLWPDYELVQAGLSNPCSHMFVIGTKISQVCSNDVHSKDSHFNVHVQ